MSEPRERERSAGGIAELLEQYRDEIVAEWSHRAHARAAASALDRPALVDDVPQLLGRIAAALAAGRDPAIELDDVPDEHARTRLRQGYDLASAAAELADLRETILDAWRAHRGDQLPTSEAKLLDRAIDATVSRSVARFAAARERTLVALDRVSSSALGTGDLAEFLPRLLTVLLETTEAADSAFLLLLDHDGDTLRVRAAAGVHADLGDDFSVALGEGLAGLVAARGEPVMLRDASQDPLVRNPGLRARGFHAVYAVPLVHERQVIGVAKMASLSAYEFSEEDRQLFRVMAQRATSLIVQARLVDARRHMAEIVEHGDAFFTVDATWRVTDVNAALEALARKPRGEILGRVMWEIWPEAASPALGYWREYHRCMRDRVAVSFEERYAALDLWTEVTAYPTSDGGMAVFLRDVTERRRVEEELRRRESELRRLFAITPDMVCVAGFDGYFRRVNPAFTAVLGYSETELLRRPFLDFVHPDDRVTTATEVQRLAAGAETLRFRIRCRKRTGEDVWVSWNALPDPEVKGTFIAVGRDISEEVRRGEFDRQLMAIVSHDLRNPVHAVLLGASTLLRRADLDARAERGLLRIRAAAERATRLITDLLDFARVHARQELPVHRTPTDLHAVAREVLDEIRAAHPDRELRLEQPGVADGVWDRDRIAQVVANLTLNALKFSLPGSVVTVRTRCEGSTAVLEVHNLGEPIPPELLGEVFAPYRRGGHRSAPGEGVGLGLGLYITDQVVRAHGGRITVRSSRDEGTTMTVELPRGAAVAESP